MSDFAALEKRLCTQICRGQVSHAYIFCGRNAEEQALCFAAALLCPSRQSSGQACGHCASCRHVSAASHPDCRFVDPVNGVHRADSMRRLVMEAGLSASMGVGKIFIIRAADKITEEAANTLLKLLEEPAADTTLILLCAQPDALLPTIISRCQLFMLGTDWGLEPQLSPDMLHAAEDFLQDLPRLAIYQVLIKARDFEKDREGQVLFFLCLLKILHAAVRAEIELPMGQAAALRSANMLESCLEMMDKNVNQKLLADVVYLRLWQNSQR